jgi:hypothetical protein
MALHFRLEYFTCSLTRKYAHESAEMILHERLDRVIRVRANALHLPSLLGSSCSSSFGHDTPAHVERRCWFTYSFCCVWAALSAAPSASATDRRIAVAA